jgi:low temperature requirement protein LtrA
VTETSLGRRIQPNPVDANVSPLELFFDLVFVFALTQVTAFMADHLTGHGLLRSVLILGLLWWSWVGYAWLCNVASTETGVIRLVLLVAMAAMFLLALSIPEAFADMPGGLPGPIVITVCYFVFRLMHLAIFWLIAEDDPGLRRQLVRFAPSMIGATALLLVASQLDGATQTLFWALALAADYVGTLLGGADGWRLRSPSHFSERHGLIVIVALGESIVAIGVGVAELPISVPIVLASVLGLTVSAAMWWAYFDMSALHAERALAQEPEATRARFARDSYSYLHLPLVAGIVLTALGMKKVLEYVGDLHDHQLTDPLEPAAAAALYGGVLVYLLGHVAFKWRTGHAWMPPRVIASAVILLGLTVVARVPALASLAMLALVLGVMVAFETVHYADHRRVLHGEHQH